MLKMMLMLFLSLCTSGLHIVLYLTVELVLLVLLAATLMRHRERCEFVFPSVQLVLLVCTIIIRLRLVDLFLRFIVKFGVK